MKGLRIGRRRGRESELPLSPLELALRPALVEGRWQVPDRFNFTRDVVESLAGDPKRRALTSLGGDGVIEPRSFREIADGATVWAVLLRDRSVGVGDRVVLLAGSTIDWLEAVLGAWKVGAVVVPAMPSTTPSQLERIVSSTDAVLVVAERPLEPTIERMGFSPDVHLFDVGTKRNSKDVPTGVPTHDTATRDLAFVSSTPSVGGRRKDVAHTHGSVFATRVQAEHWLDVGRGDAVWCTAETTSPLTMWNTVIGPWSRGAEIVLQQEAFDPDERLDLLFRLGPSILCQSPAEYRALAEHPKLERFRSPRLRRLVSTGDFLDPEVVAVFEERWGMSIADGYGQAETNIVVANLADGAVKPGSFGRPMPGHHVAVIDDQGNELPAGIEGDLAVRGRPPTLFAGYWEQPEETKSAFLGDWYLTGDVAHVDDEGYFTFVGRAEDVITSSGRTFGPHEVERVLDGHDAIAATAVVGIRDLQRGGHFVRAFVVPKGAGGSEQLEAELRQYVAQTLPNQQVPREIVFVDELPTVGWKINRHELRERPLGGRPLWEMPPTTDAPVSTTTPAPPPSFEAEFSPRIEAHAEPHVELVPEPEPVVNEPVIAPAAPELVEEPPVLTEPEPVVAEAVPHLEPEPEPEPLVVEPEPQPQPVGEAVEPVAPEPEPEPLVAEPEHVAVEVPEPPIPEAEAVEAEVVVEAAPEPEPEPEAVPEPEPEPEVADDPVAPEAPAPTLVVVPPPEPEPEAKHTPEFASPDAEPLPDFVVDPPDEVPPVVIPEPEPEPDLSGPLPEFVVEPGAERAPEPAPPLAHDQDEEEDLGPLPDYVIDPTLPPELRPAPPPPPAPPEIALKLKVEVTSDSNTDDEPVSTELELNFPSVTSFSITRDDGESRERPDRPGGTRRTGGADLGRSKSRAAEPGDEMNEVSWMEGLSNRLSAYSLSEDDEPPVAESDEDDTTA